MEGLSRAEFVMNGRPPGQDVDRGEIAGTMKRGKGGRGRRSREREEKPVEGLDERIN